MYNAGRPGYLCNFSFALFYRRGVSHDHAGFLSRLPPPNAPVENSGPDRIGGLDVPGVFWIRIADGSYHPSSAPNIGLVGSTS